MHKTIISIVRAIASLLVISSVHGLDITIASRVDKETGMQNRVQYVWPSGEFLHIISLEQNGQVLQYLGLEIPALIVGSVAPADLLEEINRSSGFGLCSAGSFSKPPLVLNSSFNGHTSVGISLGLLPGHFSLFAFDRKISRHAGALLGGSLARLGVWEAITVVSQLLPADKKEDWTFPILPMISPILGHSAIRIAFEFNPFSFFFFSAVSGGVLQRPDVRAAVKTDIQLVFLNMTLAIAYSGPDYVALYGRRPAEALKLISEMLLGPFEWRERLQVEIEGIHTIAVHHPAIYPGVCRESGERVYVRFLFDIGNLQFNFDWELMVNWNEHAVLSTKQTLQGGASFRTDNIKVQLKSEGIRDTSGYGFTEPPSRFRMDMQAGVEGKKIGLAGSIGIIKDESCSLRYGFDVDLNAVSGSAFCRIDLEHPAGLQIAPDGWDISFGWRHEIEMIEPILGVND